MGPRKADGSLPRRDFMHLAANSVMINKGRRRPAFVGSAPDLGAFRVWRDSTGTGGPPGPPHRRRRGGNGGAGRARWHDRRGRHDRRGGTGGTGSGAGRGGAGGTTGRGCQVQAEFPPARRSTSTGTADASRGPQRR
jgi:hypothetical protein